MSLFDLRDAFAAVMAKAGMPADSLWLDTAEAAAYINRTEDYVRRVLHSGRVLRSATLADVQWASRCVRHIGACQELT